VVFFRASALAAAGENEARCPRFFLRKNRLGLGNLRVKGFFAKISLVKSGSGHVIVKVFSTRCEAQDFDHWVEIGGMQGYT
jgi:hypothetical protein